MHVRKLIPELKASLEANNVDVNSELVQGFLKRYPSWDEEYSYFLTFTPMKPMLEPLLTCDIDETKLSEVTRFYFHDIFTCIGFGSPFYQLLTMDWVTKYYVDGLAKEFIADTYNYILTGKRLFNVHIWQELMEKEVEM